MKTLSILRPIFLSLSIMGAAIAGPAMAQACLSDGEIQAAVANGQILPVAQVLAREGITAQVLSVRVCDNGGGLSYELAVLTPTGEARNMTLSAY